MKWALAGNELNQEQLKSLATQTRWLMRRIEWHLLGNHLLANAKALVLAGLFFRSAEAERWLARGLAIYARQLPEQILADGGHFELSPMYHAIILEDLLDLINAARTYGHAENPVFRNLPEITTRMREWLAAMTHPDGGTSFFNDAAFGIAASRADLEAYAARLNLPSVDEPSEGVHHLAASGYVRVNRGDMAAILDLAAVGPDYIPGHAHADTLSFELSLGMERIIVNGGTSSYAPGPLREAQRATRAHSSVEIAGESSSEVWANFRVARRARVQDVNVYEQGAVIVVSGAHNGYHRLDGRPLHRRTWTFDVGSLSLHDEIEGKRSLPAVARLFLGPDVLKATSVSATRLRLATATGRAITVEATSHAHAEAASWYPEFGRSVPISVIATPFDSGSLTTGLCWS